MLRTRLSRETAPIARVPIARVPITRLPIARLPIATVLIAVVAVVLAALPTAGAAADASRGGRGHGDVTPIVLFPAYTFTRLRVDVHGQTTDPACPATGSFEILNGDTAPSAFSSICKDELITLRYRGDRRVPMARRFTEQPGVRTSIPDYGSTASAPAYEPMYRALEAAGYVRDRSIRVAGYDFRLTPDQSGFLRRTIRLIEQTARANGNRPVHLVGHSNGPLYIQYLLTHVSPEWKHRYVHGFTPLAGNFPGQGVLYPVLFTGLELLDFTFPTTPAKARSSALMLATAPSTYMSASDPEVFGRREVVVVDRSTGRSYTQVDGPALFADAGQPTLAEIARHYIGFVRFTDARHFPDVDVYAEKGSGLETVVGAVLDDLSVGQVIDPATDLLTRDGDVNQEDITNDAVAVWAQMRCHHFSLTDNPGVTHFELPSDPDVLARLIAAAAAPRTPCRHG
jgi:lecithin-cholesterol acyltransferase